MENLTNGKALSLSLSIPKNKASEARVRLLFTLLILATFGLSAKAEPTPTVKEFMNTPVSLFSMGLLRLEIALQREMQEGETVVSYDWDSNRINLSFFESIVYGEKACINLTEAGCKNRCKDFFKRLQRKICLGNDCKVNRLPEYFGHRGYSQKGFSSYDTDQAAAKSLLPIVDAQVSLFFGNKGQELICRGQITDKEPSFLIQ